MNIINKRVFQNSMFCLLVIIIAMVLIPIRMHCAERSYIVVSKKKCILYVINSQDTIVAFQCGVAKNFGNKTRKSDYRTPEGTFRIVSIEKASDWTHDFEDGYGERKGAYGLWFIRLQVPKFKGIGIHGTCFPESIGTRSSEGCIRLNNEDLSKLMTHVFVGMQVVIEPDI